MPVEKRNGIINTIITAIVAMLAGITFTYTILVRPVGERVSTLEACITQDKRDQVQWREADKRDQAAWRETDSLWKQTIARELGVVSARLEGIKR
jgi:hypothetical protein